MRSIKPLCEALARLNPDSSSDGTVVLTVATQVVSAKLALCERINTHRLFLNTTTGYHEADEGVEIS